jgi:23S rRNA (cytosine1962-C5)-methyltransferase
MPEYPTACSYRHVSTPPLSKLIEQSLEARAALFDAEHVAAVRLFNGFTEGCPDVVIDLYGRTIVINNYAEPPEAGLPRVQDAAETLRARLAWLRAGIVKDRNSKSADQQRGQLIFGGPPDEKNQENGIWYAIDLQLGRDASFYLDTRNLRNWASRNLRGKTVLNAFAYTGSLGVAAAASGARRVVHLDRNERFLDVAKRSYALNGLGAAAGDFIRGDFFRQAGKFRRENQRFDCVFIDPPIFAAGSAGTVDQLHESARLINKARPLVEDGGYLVAVNNALYLGGKDYMDTIERLCADGYLRLVELIPVPDDCVGYGPARGASPVADPAPFNHSTKIAVLQVERK